ncbi:unnamed protein product, partial [marine sediment metagenome]
KILGGEVKAKSGQNQKESLGAVSVNQPKLQLKEIPTSGKSNE